MSRTGVTCGVLLCMAPTRANLDMVITVCGAPSDLSDVMLGMHNSRQEIFRMHVRTARNHHFHEQAQRPSLAASRPHEKESAHLMA